ncbi:sushi domain-containing protein 6 isoform X1 [Oryzias melastigma]|uniref:sushi domain-containing protein 6 isoform X1 n=1 Tax=Oryzias melastigma TaxID=30732 RepID=UPI000CF7FF9A|nr:sushi domain-containing protein 6 isoform X1 [Oryzias melastigma]
MSASVFDPCGRVSLVRGLLLLTSTLLVTEGRLLNCSHPLVPEHGGFRCEPSPCRGFPHRSTIRFFCETGYHVSRRKPFSSCRHGRWDPPMPTCVPVKGSPPRSETPANDSMPSMATTAVGVSIFLLTTTACLVVKSRLYPCQSRGSRRSSDQLDLMVDGLPVSLPSYEEAVYGSWGQRIPACSSPGPTQLLLSQESASRQPDGSLQPLLPSHSPDNPPPPYEEVPSSRPRDGDARQLHVPAVKDT